MIRRPPRSTLFPTRRSSDLNDVSLLHAAPDAFASARWHTAQSLPTTPFTSWFIHCAALDEVRSEEHTSELQSHLNLVCRLLLEKRNRNASASGSTSVATRHP